MGKTARIDINDVLDAVEPWAGGGFGMRIRSMAINGGKARHSS